jgi:hypothetical protein
MAALDLLRDEDVLAAEAAGAPWLASPAALAVAYLITALAVTAIGCAALRLRPCPAFLRCSRKAPALLLPVTSPRTAATQRGGAAAPPTSQPLVSQSEVPLVMVVNTRSGGGLGATVADTASSLPPHIAPEVHALTVEGLQEVLRRLVKASRAPMAAAHPASADIATPASAGALSLPIRLVCAGGDGTVSAIVRVLSERGLAGSVPVAVMPLGTGNDVARSLGMGGSAPSVSAQSLASWLSSVRSAPTRPIDVWHVSFSVHPGGSIRVLRQGVETALPEREVRGSSVLYTSVGIDARLVWAVEQHRTGKRFLNQLLYFLIGAWYTLAGWWTNAITSGAGKRATAAPSLLSSAPPGQVESMEVDGARVRGDALPGGLHSLIAISAPSYAGGTNLWPRTWSLTPSAYASMFPPGIDSGLHGPAWMRRAVAGPVSAPDSLLSALPQYIAALQPGLGQWVGAVVSLFLPVWRILLRAYASLVYPWVGSEPWFPQSMEDGRLELLGCKSLFQISGIVGTRTGILGGIYRLAQPSSLEVNFAPPPFLLPRTGEAAALVSPTASMTSPLPATSTAATAPATAAPNGGEAAAPARRGIRARLAAPVTAIRNAAKKIRAHIRGRRRQGKALAVAAPEMVDDDRAESDGSEGSYYGYGDSSGHSSETEGNEADAEGEQDRAAGVDGPVAFDGPPPPPPLPPTALSLLSPIAETPHAASASGATGKPCGGNQVPGAVSATSSLALAPQPIPPSTEVAGQSEGRSRPRPSLPRQRSFSRPRAHSRSRSRSRSRGSRHAATDGEAESGTSGSDGAGGHVFRHHRHHHHHGPRRGRQKGYATLHRSHIPAESELTPHERVKGTGATDANPTLMMRQADGADGLDIEAVGSARRRLPAAEAEEDSGRGARSNAAQGAHSAALTPIRTPKTVRAVDSIASASATPSDASGTGRVLFSPSAHPAVGAVGMRHRAGLAADGMTHAEDAVDVDTRVEAEPSPAKVAPPPAPPPVSASREREIRSAPSTSHPLALQDSESAVHIQVDGEAYRVVGLASLKIEYAGKALMVAFGK